MMKSEYSTECEVCGCYNVEVHCVACCKKGRLNEELKK